MADVYTLTGTAYGNAVAVFDRAGNGTLTPAGSVLTGGSGAPSGGQGALALDHNQLVAVNAGSNTVSLFRIDGHGPGLRDVEPSGGVSPLSATIHGRLVYVLNSGGTANITGFFIWHDRLVPVPNSTRSLSTAAPGPAQVQFSPDGRTLAVTEKATNRIDTYAVGFDGTAGGPVVSAVRRRHAVRLRLRQARAGSFVSEATLSDVSSYSIADNGIVSPISATVLDHQTAPCWVAVTDDGKYAYTANAGSNSVSGYAIAKNGAISLLDAGGATARRTRTRSTWRCPTAATSCTRSPTAPAPSTPTA